jgi:hypothetical protein
MCQRFLNEGKWYSEDVIAYKTFVINANFAKSDADALAILAQDARTKSIATAIRDYTSKLEQKGLTKQASAIKQRFIEKAMTTNVSQNTQATIQAINSGSPTAVLKVFQ